MNYTESIQASVLHGLPTPLASDSRTAEQLISFFEKPKAEGSDQTACAWASWASWAL